MQGCHIFADPHLLPRAGSRADELRGCGTLQLCVAVCHPGGPPQRVCDAGAARAQARRWLESPALLALGAAAYVALLLAWARCGALDAVGAALRACSPLPSVRAPLTSPPPVHPCMYITPPIVNSKAAMEATMG